MMYQYYCESCNYHRPGLLDQPAIGIGSYSTICPECGGRYNSYETDSNGMPSTYNKGDRVYVLPLQMEATVIKQILHYDGDETFWGNLELQYDDGLKGTSNSWQCRKVEK